jgi:hypothetical protein
MRQKTTADANGGSGGSAVRGLSAPSVRLTAFGAALVAGVAALIGGGLVALVDGLLF